MSLRELGQCGRSHPDGTRRTIGTRPDAALTNTGATAAPGKRRSFQDWSCLFLLLSALAACQTSGKPEPLPPTRDRNYLCQSLAPGETIEDEALCEENKHWFSPEHP
jgi:hypothetical protein